ncbi:MAG: AAA family ATPase, partial [Candidatus Competibacteraceae bacterium]|nr:AAA family ATPase [Candidatus Competibacteraceae bacterium]
MKIERLYLKAYGVFSDYRLDFTGGPDFHIIHGPNEAGKSTTLRALIGLLFGIEERTNDNFIHQNNRLRIGAVLATANNDRLNVMRRKGRKQTLFVLDETRGEECTDQPLAEDTLSRCLSGLDENLYRALFGLDLDGLVRGSEALLEGKGEMGQSLFAAAAGLADLRQLSDQLETEASNLFLPRATARTINVALRELDEQRKLAREATVRSSAWEQADRTRRQAEKKHTELRAELGRLREEQRRLSRVVAHLPLVAEREAMRQEITALASVPLLPADAQQQRIETEERLRAAMDNQREAQATLDELRQQQSRRVVREVLLSHAGDIERLHHAAKNYRGALERLPRIEAEIESAYQTLITQLRAIDPMLTVASSTPADLSEYVRALMPLPTARARVQALVEEHGVWSIQDEQCAEQECKLRGALQQLRQALATQPAAMPFELLETARERVTGQGDFANQQTQLEREIAELETTLAREATALWSGTLDELIALRVPLLATVNELGDRYRQLAENERLLKDQDRILQRDLGERERELRGLAAAGEIVTHDQVRQARQHRDASWQRIRQDYIEYKDNSNQPVALPALEPALAKVFESALREADRLADLLHADAKRATSVENLRQRIADMQQARTDLAQQFTVLATQRSDLDARWTVIAESLHQADLTPGAAIEWLQRQALLVERATRLEALRQERREIAAALVAARKTLDQALQNCGLPGLTEDETWSAALSRARTAIEQARQTATERANLIKSINQHETGLSEIVAKRMRLAEKRAAWQTQWNATVADLRLSPEALPAEARVRLEQWDQLSKSLSTLETLNREAQQEKTVRCAFEGALAELARAVAEPMDGQEADRVAITLYEALSVARNDDR